SDGGLSGKTASLKHYYKGGNEQGVLRLDFGFFREIALKAQMAGFKIATHAIGDRAIDLVLQVYQSIAGRIAGKHNTGLSTSDSLNCRTSHV
ncbi:MAG: hypothetical protein ACKOCO_13715, partial [Bacteroidota bacterium]